MSGRLAGKRAVLVGSGQTAGRTVGFGRATTLLFGREGASVMLVDIDRDSAEATATAVRAEGGIAVVHVGDHTSPEDCDAMAEAAKRELGGVDILYDGVGIAGPRAGPADTAPDEWDRVMDLNLKGMFLATRSIVPLMVEQDAGGSIVLISSAGAVGGLSWVPTAYGVSKAGVNRLVSSLAAVYAPHDIRCNGIMPGLIDTPMAIDTTVGDDGRTPAGLTRDEYAAHREALVPMRYKGSVMDVAFAALYLASDESRYVSVAVLPVDGALLAR